MMNLRILLVLLLLAATCRSHTNFFYHPRPPPTPKTSLFARPNIPETYRKTAVLPQSCRDAQIGVSPRRVVVLADGYEVMCDLTTDGGGWTVIQRRANGQTNFTRGWHDYKYGFGDYDNGEFYLGNEYIHHVTSARRYELRIEMEWKGVKKFAEYAYFRVNGEQEFYRLHVGGFLGNVGDSFSPVHSGREFSTFDRDNDNHEINCAERFHGGWWYNACHTANLNGVWGVKDTGEGINWMSFTGYRSSLAFCEMKIRPVQH
ncbi:unnamed protein product [Lymnaea stagnalis]|uniref:Fibrinogen C-terminal domain-containing protein n=1 Tax=Lymnaea stagnalis TaxID=6523 RepID=A0AAV2HPE6_LYMST